MQPLLPRELHVLGVDDDDDVAVELRWLVCGLILPLEHRGNLAGQTAQHVAPGLRAGGARHVPGDRRQPQQHARASPLPALTSTSRNVSRSGFSIPRRSLRSSLVACAACGCISAHARILRPRGSPPQVADSADFAVRLACPLFATSEGGAGLRDSLARQAQSIEASAGREWARSKLAVSEMGENLVPVARHGLPEPRAAAVTHSEAGTSDGVNDCASLRYRLARKCLGTVARRLAAFPPRSGTWTFRTPAFSILFLSYDKKEATEAIEPAPSCSKATATLVGAGGAFLPPWRRAVSSRTATTSGCSRTSRMRIASSRSGPRRTSTGAPGGYRLQIRAATRLLAHPRGRPGSRRAHRSLVSSLAPWNPAAPPCSVFEGELADHIPVIKTSISGTRLVGRMTGELVAGRGAHAPWPCAT